MNSPEKITAAEPMNAAHEVLMKAASGMCSQEIAAAITGTPRPTKPQIKAAEKMLKAIHDCGMLASQPGRGGVALYSLTTPVSNINKLVDVSPAGEGETSEVCDLVQTGSGSQAEDSPISDEVCAQMQSLNTVTSDEFSLLNVIADIRAAIGDPEGKIMLGDLADAVRAKIEGLEQDLERERGRLAACGVVAMADTPESAAKARDMKGEYRSASCDDVARRVDECMALRQIDREKVRDAIADALGCMIYCCTRAWEAWSVGTMRREDFILASEDDGILDELTAAAISAIEAKPGSAS